MIRWLDALQAELLTQLAKAASMLGQPQGAPVIGAVIWLQRVAQGLCPVWPDDARIGSAVVAKPGSGKLFVTEEGSASDPGCRGVRAGQQQWRALWNVTISALTALKQFTELQMADGKKTAPAALQHAQSAALADACFASLRAMLAHAVSPSLPAKSSALISLLESAAAQDWLGCLQSMHFHELVREVFRSACSSTFECEVRQRLAKDYMRGNWPIMASPEVASAALAAVFALLGIPASGTTINSNSSSSSRLQPFHPGRVAVEPSSGAVSGSSCASSCGEQPSRCRLSRALCWVSPADDALRGFEETLTSLDNGQEYFLRLRTGDASSDCTDDAGPAMAAAAGPAGSRTALSTQQRSGTDGQLLSKVHFSFREYLDSFYSNYVSKVRYNDSCSSSVEVALAHCTVGALCSIAGPDDVAVGVWNSHQTSHATEVTAHACKAAVQEPYNRSALNLLWHLASAVRPKQQPTAGLTVGSEFLAGSASQQPMDIEGISEDQEAWRSAVAEAVPEVTELLQGAVQSAATAFAASAARGQVGLFSGIMKVVYVVVS